MKPQAKLSILSIPASSQLTWLAALAIGVLTLLFSLYLHSERRSLLRDGQNSAEQIAAFTAVAADGALDSARQLLRGMAVLARVPAHGAAIPAAEIRRVLLSWRASDVHIMDLMVLDRDGRVEHWTGVGTPPHVSDRDYYTAHHERVEGGLHVGPPLLSKVHHGRWFFALSESLRDEQGELTKVLVAVIDVSLLRKRLGVRMAIADSTQALLDKAGRVYSRTPDHDLHVGKQVSRTAEFGRLSQNDPGQTLFAVSQIDGRERIIAFRHLADYPLIGAGTIVVDELLAPWRKRFAIVATLWLVLAGAIIWVALRLREMSRAQAELARIDGLTGIFNRRSILSAASELERSSQHVGSLSLLMIDVDHFKLINDRFGHVVGDEVLRRLSELMASQVRTNDIVGRYGGEEFLVLMPDTGEDGAKLVAEKLRAAVEREITRPAPVTISVGVATTSSNRINLDQALTQADAALYAAKDAGRNCVKLASELPQKE